MRTTSVDIFRIKDLNNFGRSEKMRQNRRYFSYINFVCHKDIRFSKNQTTKATRDNTHLAHSVKYMFFHYIVP